MVRVQSARVARYAPLYLAPLVLAVALFGLRVMLSPDPVTGVDGGNWLALAAGLTGVHVKAAATVYPPLFLIVLDGVQVLLSPLEALRVAGAAVSVLPGLAAYFLLRSIGLRALAFLGFALSLSGYSLEMFAWGGYPQLLGSAAVVAAMGAFVHAAREQDSRWSVVAGVLGASAVLAEALSGLQSVVAMLVAYGVWGMAARPGWRGFLRCAALGAIVASVLSLPVVSVYVDTLARTGGFSEFNANGTAGLQPMLGDVFEEAPLLWAALCAGAVAGAGILLSRRDWPAVAMLFGLVGASFGLTLATSEVRFLYLAQAATVLGVGVLLDTLLQRYRHTRAVALSLAAAIAIVAALVTLAGLERWGRARTYYAVMDSDVSAAFGWLAQHARAEDVAASAPAWRDWPIGWWLEGISHVPTYTEADLSWLFFDDERQQAQIALAIFSQTDPRLAALDAQRHGITLLVIDTRENGRANQWLQNTTFDGALDVIFTNPAIIVLRVRPTARATTLAAHQD